MLEKSSSLFVGLALMISLSGCKSPPTAAQVPQQQPAPDSPHSSAPVASGVEQAERPSDPLLPPVVLTSRSREQSLPVPSGVASGEVTAESVMLWSRCDQPARLHFAMGVKGGARHQSALVSEARDFAGKVGFDGLTPGTQYEYLVWCSEPADISSMPRKGAVAGRFTTAPPENSAVPIRFAWGGDVGGQNVCRDAKEGYPIFKPLSAGDYDFFVALGDMVYADDPCLARGTWGNAQVPLDVKQSVKLADFHAHWRYNRAEANHQAFLAETPYYSMWDDHEIVNDFGPKTDSRPHAPYVPGAHLMPAGLQAMLDYNPLPDEGGKLYRRVRWGKHVELFFVDARQYRDENTQVDSREQPKRMLGEAQIQWLLDSLGSSDATWRFVICSVPLSTPTGLNEQARDGFASMGGSTGFEQELAGLFRRMADLKATNTVWLTTDVHIAAAFHYVPFPDRSDFVVHEFISGPMSAGFFPRDVYDPTFNPTRHFTWAVKNVAGVKTYEQAKELFNFGEVLVDANGKLRVNIVNTHGTRVVGRDVPR